MINNQLNYELVLQQINKLNYNLDLHLKHLNENVNLLKEKNIMINPIINNYNYHLNCLQEYLYNSLLDINFKINNLCIHQIEEDYIDITPDKSMKIVYCKKCEKSF